MIVRKMKTSDLDSVINLSEEVFIENDNLDKIFIAEFPYKLVVETDKGISGYLQAYKNCDKYLIGNLITDSKETLKTGTELIKHIINDAIELQLKSVFLEVQKDNISKLFYELFGFKKTITNKNYYGHLTSEVMSKKLL